jgi:hypothetical protein
MIATLESPRGIGAARLLSAWLDEVPMPLSLLSACASESPRVVAIRFGACSRAYVVKDPERRGGPDQEAWSVPR